MSSSGLYAEDYETKNIQIIVLTLFGIIMGREIVLIRINLETFLYSEEHDLEI